jgi:hypothetical protein
MCSRGRHALEVRQRLRVAWWSARTAREWIPLRGQELLFASLRTRDVAEPALQGTDNNRQV